MILALGEQAGGTAYVTDLVLAQGIGSGEYELQAGTLNAATISAGYGDSTYVQTGGTLNITTLDVSAFDEFTLSGGTINATTISGSFVQTGGTIATDYFNLAEMFVSPGYRLSGTGQLDVDIEMSISNGGHFFWADDTYTTVDIESLVVEGLGGALAIGFDFSVGSLMSGTLTGGTVDLTDGILAVTDGATATQSSSSASIKVVALGAQYGAGEYELSGTGELSTDLLSIGYLSAGTFTQSGGTLEAADALRIGYDATGTFNISGGNVSAGALLVGPGAAAGALDIQDDSAEITVTDVLELGENGELTAVAGSQIALDTADLMNASTDDSNYLGLNNLSLLFEGSTQYITYEMMFEQEEVTYNLFEVACEDMGMSNDGFDGNFALDRLLVGGDTTTGVIQLTSYVDNDLSGYESDDVLYVDYFYIGAGSLLDLNGYAIYFHTIDIDEDGVLWDSTSQWRLYEVTGGGVPEPATLSLLGMGGLALIRRRRQ